jgi:hypothetical protein
MELKETITHEKHCKEKHLLDDLQNGIYIEDADEDGVLIAEMEGDMKVYVYYTEIPKLVNILQEVYDGHRSQ